MRELALGPDPPRRLLSVGPGNGMLDLPLIASLSEAGATAEYVGVDPNDTACRRFTRGFEELKPGGVSLRVERGTIDSWESDERFDLIHAVHSIYYVPDPPATIEGLLGRLTPGGRLVVFQAPRGALNALSDCFWRAEEGASVWFSDRIAEWLAAERLPHERRRIDGRLDVTRALDPEDPIGRLVLDFALHVEAERLDATVRALAIDCLRAIADREGNRWLVPHPVDAFVIRGQ